MKIKDLVHGLNITVTDYYYRCYNDVKNLGGFKNPVKVLKKENNAKAFIIESDTFEDIDKTLFWDAPEKEKKLFPQLLSVKFYFILLEPSTGDMEFMRIPEYVSTDLNKVERYAKMALKKFDL